MRRYITPCILAGLLICAAGQTAQLRALQTDTQTVAAQVQALRREQAALSQEIRGKSQHATVSYTALEPERVFIHDPDMPLSPELQEHTLTTCEAFDIDPDILFRLMWRESRMEPDAWCIDANGLESTGLCQINAVAYPFLSERGIDPTESPEANITAACAIIAYYRDDMGYPLQDALAAYGAGTGGMYTDRAQEQAKLLLKEADPWAGKEF